MSGAARSFKKFAKKSAGKSPMATVSDKLGFGRSNTLRRLADPFEEARRQHAEGGSGQLKQSLKEGGLTESPMAKVNDALGFGRSNSLRRLADPLEETRRQYAEGGSAQVKRSLKEGDLTDPGGIFHKVNPDTEIGEAPPAPTMGAATANVDTRRSRRRRGVLANMFGVASSSNVGRNTLG